MDQNNTSRRNFLKGAAVVAPIAALTCRSVLAQAGAAAPAAPAAAPAAAKFVADTDATAKALGYVADAAKADRPKKGDVEGKNQTCLNCQFFTKGASIDGKDAGKCLMIMSGAVAAGGWCKSWAKKV